MASGHGDGENGDGGSDGWRADSSTMGFFDGLMMAGGLGKAAISG